MSFEYTNINEEALVAQLDFTIKTFGGDIGSAKISPDIEALIVYLPKFFGVSGVEKIVGEFKEYGNFRLESCDPQPKYYPLGYDDPQCAYNLTEFLSALNNHLKDPVDSNASKSLRALIKQYGLGKESYELHKKSYRRTCYFTRHFIPAILSGVILAVAIPLLVTGYLPQVAAVFVIFFSLAFILGNVFCICSMPSLDFPQRDKVIRPLHAIIDGVQQEHRQQDEEGPKHPSFGTYQSDLYRLVKKGLCSDKNDSKDNEDSNEFEKSESEKSQDSTFNCC